MDAWYILLSENAVTAILRISRTKALKKEKEKSKQNTFSSYKWIQKESVCISNNRPYTVVSFTHYV